MLREIAIIGREGQLARELADLAWPAHLKPRFFGRGEINLFDAGDIYARLAPHAPFAIINSAAHTGVDAAETEFELAYQLNAEAPARLAAAAQLLDAPLIHVSTDYVFAGTAERPYREADATAPQSVYGQSKLAGERALALSPARTLTVRSASLFGRHGNNFLQAIRRRLADPATPIRMVADQVMSPTPASALAATLLRMAIDLAAGKKLPPLLHFAGAPAASWFDFTAAILEAFATNAAGPLPELHPARLADLGRPAPRPRMSALDCTLAASLGYAAPDWRASLPALVGAWNAERIAA